MKKKNMVQKPFAVPNDAHDPLPPVAGRHETKHVASNGASSRLPAPGE
jgi:hypothetical protein